MSEEARVLFDLYDLNAESMRLLTQTDFTQLQEFVALSGTDQGAINTLIKVIEPMVPILQGERSPEEGEIEDFDQMNLVELSSEAYRFLLDVLQLHELSESTFGPYAAGKILHPQREKQGHSRILTVDLLRFTEPQLKMLLANAEQLELNELAAKCRALLPLFNRKIKVTMATSSQSVKMPQEALIDVVSVVGQEGEYESNSLGGVLGIKPPKSE
jgi:hypothetical protein